MLLSSLSRTVATRCGLARSLFHSAFFTGLLAALSLLLPSAPPVFAQQVLAHHVSPAVLSGQAALVNALPPDQQLHLSLVLPLQNQADLTALLTRLYDPTSPDYRHFLSVDQFTQRFAPSAADYGAVVDFAQTNGLTVTGSPANRLIVPVTGSVAAINRAFGVSMSTYQHPTQNRTFFSPDREPSLPSGLKITHIAGMNNFALPHPMVILPQGVQPLGGSGSGPAGSYLGSDMRAAYYGANQLTGNGQTIGLLEFDGYDINDVNLSFSNAGQTYTVPINNVLLDGATGTGTTFDGEGEVVLDIVQSIGMAPGLSQVRVYIGEGLDDANILNSMASENIAKIISCSWSWTPDDPSVDDPFFQEFAAQGQSFLTASGDSGAYDPSVDPYFYPQEDAFVTAVGGTHLTTTGPGGAWTSETAWNSGGAGSGGGISPDSIAIPSWQTGLANSANAASATLRNSPDIAMEGDFDNYGCAAGECSTGYAGTSFAAPRWAGFLALVNQQAVEAGNAPMGGIGFMNPSVYRLAQGVNATSDFHDITSGNNDTSNQPTWFNAVAGFDLVTGWGSAAGQHLIDDLAGPQVPGFWLQASQPLVSVDQGTSATTTLTVTDAGGFASPVTLAITSTLPTGLTATLGTNPTQGTSVITLTAAANAPGSTTPLTITGTAGTLTATTTVTVAVHSPTFALAASPSPVTLNQGATTTTTVTVTPEYGFTGAVNLAVSGLPSGVTATFAANPTSGTSVLTVTASATATPGTTPLTITGTAGSLTITLPLSLSVHGPSFTLSGNPTIDVGQGSSGNDYLYVTDLYGFTGNVNLTVSGLPSGVTGTFAPNPTTGYSTLALNVSSTAALGSSNIIVTGISGALTATTTSTLTIHAPSFTLSSPGSVSVGQGSTGQSYLYITPQYGFTGSVTFTVAGLPAGVTALWNPNPTSGSTTLTLAATNTAAIGQYTLSITGTSGTLSASTTLTLGVYAPTFTLGTYGPVSLGQGTSTTTSVYVTPEYGFTGSVNLSATGLPSGVTASFSPNPTTGYSTLTLTAASTTPLGQHTVTLTGTSGSKTVTTTLTLGVYVPTFTLYSYNSVSLGQGTSATAYVSINPQYGFNGNVTLAATGLPAGVTATFSPNPTNGSTTVTFTASSTATLGQYTVTLTGTSGTQTASTTLSLGVYVPTFTLYAGSATIGQGTSGSSYVTISPQYGFNGSVTLAASGLPNGVTATFSPNPTTGYGSSNIIFTASSSAAIGQYTVVITGTSGTQTTSTTLSLGVFTPTFTLSSSYNASVGQGSSAPAYVYVYDQYGFSSNVTLAVAGLPSGVTASFAQNPTNYSTALNFTASPTAAVGQYTVVVTGTSGAQTASTTLTLGVYAPSFQLYGSSGNLTLNQNGTGTASFYIQSSYGFNGNVTFTASNLPSGVTASFSPNPTTTATTLTLTASSSAAPGVANVTITGTSGAATASTTLPLTVNASTFTLNDAPSEISLLPGNSAASTVSVAPQFGFNGPVTLAIAGLPSGVTGQFSQNPATSASTLTLTAGSSAVTGSATATITGTSGTLTVTAPLAVAVRSASAATATTLTITSGNTPATTVPSNTAITLKAAVTAGSTPLTAGQVNFCDANATACDPVHLLGSAQLTSAGTAALTFIPGPGNHTYKAVFPGITGEAPSTSAASTLAVSSSQIPTTTLTQTGSPGQYTLTATVTGVGPAAPSGSVSFIDTTRGNASLGTAPLTPSPAILSYAAATSPTTGAGPSSVAIADLNGDGKPDLVVSNGNVGSLTLLYGNGDGTFTPANATLPTGAGPAAVVTADFNADGKIDVAVVNRASNSVTVLLNNGDGVFTPAPLSPQTGANPTCMVTGDFNGDGKLDLAVLNASSSSVTILLGDGDGTFTPSSLSPQTGSNPEAIIVGDFNGDGISDFAVANGGNNNVSILLGNGDGTFSQGPDVPVGSDPQALSSGDFNHDGIPDLAVLNYYDSTVTILLGKGDGTFTASTVSLSITFEPISLLLADLNGDGTPDLAVSFFNSGKILTLLGNGDGTFTAGPTITAGNPTFMAAADLNGDGIPDLAVTDNQTNTLTILPGQLAQSAAATATGIAPLGTGAHAVTASFPGDTVYAASASTPTQLTAQPLTPTLVVTPSAATFTTLQAVTVTISVSGGTNNPTPTGTVTLTTGNYTSAATTLTNGTATLTLPAGALVAGIATLNVTYTPDTPGATTYNPASGSSTVTVTQAPKTTPTLTLTPSAATITTTQSLTATITVSPAGGYPNPTGAVTLSSAGYTSAPAPLTNNAASLTLPAGALAAGTDTLTATYTPDTAASILYNPANATTTITVTTPPKTTPTVALTFSSTSITAAQPVIATITVTGTAGNPTPTGTLTLAGAGYISPANPVSNGPITLTVPAGALATGTDTLTATYTPDSAGATTYNPAFATSSLSVAAPPKVTPTIVVTPSATSITTAQSLTVTVAVSAPTGNPTPTGSVTLTSGTYTTQQLLTAATTTFTLAPGTLPTGTDTLNATYTPNTAATAYNPSTQTSAVTVTPAIGTASATITATAAPTTITDMQSLTVTVSVAGSTSQPSPTGLITLASGTYTTQQDLTNGSATFTVSAGTLPDGQPTLTATYTGDPTYAPVDTTTTVSVAPALLSASTPAAIAAGATATAALIFQAGTYAGTLNLTCALTAYPTNAQSQPSCNLSPATLQSTAGNTATSTLSVTTTAGSAALAKPFVPWKTFGLGTPALACLLLLLNPARKRRRLPVLALLLALASIGGILGCGGSGGASGGTIAKTTIPATTSGQYTFTVTGSDAANPKTTFTTAVTVTVE